MEEREEIILAVILSVLGFLALIIIISILIWYILRRKSQKLIKHRQQYQRSQKFSSNNLINNKRKRRKKRFNTNESTVSLSFTPPHLINQNVKNLDQLLGSETSLHYEDRPLTYDFDRCYTNSATEPVYTSSSSISTPLSNIPLTHSRNPRLNNLHFQFLNELNHVLHSKQEQKSSNSLKYSQSCRPFDYYRSITPSTNSSIENFFQPTYIRTTNSTLIRKTHLTQLRDDTAILY